MEYFEVKSGISKFKSVILNLKVEFRGGTQQRRGALPQHEKKWNFEVKSEISNLKWNFEVAHSSGGGHCRNTKNKKNGIF
mmetsp:Transcript_50820/g.115418  ORF Transcript_50820/g.115418 Transcript_50820/m.115418 type:complete len:80 (-) Transcript_50820:92-331(-)